MNHVLLHVPAGNGSEVIVGEYAAQGPGREAEVHAKRLNVNNGAATSLSYGAPPDVRQWMFDDKGEPRLVVTRAQGRAAHHWRDAASGQWRLLAAFDAYRAPWSPHHVDGNGGLFETVPAGPDGILTEAGNPPLWRAYPAEGHGLFKTENRVDFMTQREGFLAQHLAPK